MKDWRLIASRIDRFSDWVGGAVSWLALLMVLAGAFNAVARYLSRYIGENLSSNAFIELQWYMFSALFLLGAGYTLKNDAHVRVDIFYGRVSAKSRAWINLLGTLVFLMPFSIFMIVLSWPSVYESWSILEKSPDPGGLPRYPIKTLVPLAFLLLIVQGLAEAIKHLAVVRGSTAPDTGQNAATGGGP